MSNDLPIVGILPGGKDQIRNVGIARILGAQLTAAGYKINWLYYITDIGVLATYENQGRDCWLGADGRPVAGTAAVFAAMGPAFEGQRFYNITTQTPMQFKGGAWGGTTWASYQPSSPSSIEATTGMILEPERSYLIKADNIALVMQGGGRWLDGHTFNIKVVPGAENSTLTATNGVLLVTISEPAGATSTTLVQGQEYGGVYSAGIVYMFTDTESSFLRKQNNLSELEDVAIARENLSVLSVAESVGLVNSITADVNSGLEFTGSAGSPVNPRKVALQFATDAELIAGTAGKVVSPAVLQTSLATVVNNALSASVYNALTGLMVSSAAFTATAFTSTVLEYSGFEAFFNPDPALLSQPEARVTVPAGSVGLPSASGWVLYDLIVDAAGTVQLTSSRTTLGTACRLAYVLTHNSAIVEVWPAPHLSTSDSELRNSRLSFTGGVVSYGEVSAGTLEAAAYTEQFESCNWNSKIPTPHIRYVGESPELSFVYTDGIAVDPAATTVDGRKLLAGSVGVAEYGIQRVLRAISGQYYLVPTTQAYASMSAAEAAIASLPELGITALRDYCREVAYLIIRGDQYTGSAALDLSNPLKFKALEVLASEGSASSGAGGANKSGIVVEAGGVLEANNLYILATNDVVLLPAALSNGLWIRIKVAPGFTPTVRANAGNIIDVTDNSSDTEVLYDIPPDSEDVYTTKDGNWLY